MKAVQRIGDVGSDRPADDLRLGLSTQLTPVA